MQGGDAPGGFHVPPATVYNLGRRHLGHIHVTGTVDLSFPRALCDELIASGRVIPHPAGLACTVTTNLAGIGGISIPCGFTRASSTQPGLPIGLQMQFRPFDEERMLRAAAMYQRATDWHTRRPVMT